MAIYVEAEENISSEINIFDIEDDTEDQEKVISHLVLACVWSMNYAVPFHINTLVNLSVGNDNLLITQIDLPPPASI